MADLENALATSPTAASDAAIVTESNVQPESVDKDKKGTGYIVQLIGVYLLFFVSMVIIAWFGIFSEV